MSAAESAPEPRLLLGLLLIEMGVISEEQLEQALEAQKESGEPLGKVLVACGHASRLAIQDALARQSGFAFEPEHGYGTGLRTKLVAVERRPEPQAESEVEQLLPTLECVPDSPARVAPELLDDHEGGGEAFQRVCAELTERDQRVQQLEGALEATLRERAALEARVGERELRVGELESELQTVRTELDGLRHREPSHPATSDRDGAEDFLAAVERAKRHLLTRRAQLQEREDRRSATRAPGRA